MLPSDRSPVESLAVSLARRYAVFPGVAAVALGGSRAAGLAAPDADLDLYVYAEPVPPIHLRAALAGSSERRELDHHVWETGDAWVDGATGVVVDVTYRAPGWIEGELARVLDRHEASVGYSTAIWHNVRAARSLVDRDGWFAALQARARVPYPPALVRAIVAKNHPLLRRSLFSFLRQTEGAIARGDAVAVQHRLTAFFSSYLDVLFALNREPHPGEKRLVRYAEARSPRRPPDFAGRVEALLAAAAPPPDASALRRLAHGLIDDLDALLQADGLISAAEFPPTDRSL